MVYYSKARNIYFASKQIVNEYNGISPNDYNEIIKLKHNEQHSVGAIDYPTFKQPYTAIDGNKQRVTSRFWN